MKECSVEGCSYPVFSTGFCKRHGYLSPKSKNKGKKPPSPLRHTKPSPISSKRVIDNKSYRQICDEIDREAIANKEYCCFFCGGEIQGKAQHHHALGRSGKLMTDKRYIILGHALCHSEQYHKWTIGKLLETGWYGSFCVRLREFNNISYDKEMRKLIKYFEL